MPTFDDLARRAAAELHEQVRPHVRVDSPVLPTMSSRQRHRLLIPVAAALVVAGVVGLSIVLTRPAAHVIAPSPSTFVGASTTTPASTTTLPPTTTTTTTTTTTSTAPSQVTTIDRQTPALLPGRLVYRSPLLPGDGVTAAFVPGVGVIGVTGGAAKDTYELAIVDRGTPNKIGVRLHGGVHMVGGPDGRLYVNDVGASTFSAYEIHDGRATLVAGPVAGVWCEALEFPPGAAAAYCGDTTKLTLGPVDATNGWALFNSGHIWGYPPGYTVSPPPYSYDHTMPEPFEQGYDLADGTRLWLFPYEGGTGVVFVSAGLQRTTAISASVACVDLVHHVIYAWDPVQTPTETVTLRAYDYTALTAG